VNFHIDYARLETPGLAPRAMVAGWMASVKSRPRRQPAIKNHHGRAAG
jgi:hypothetical protein